MSSAPTPDAHAYPLLIKQLLLMPLAWQLGREALTGRIGVWRQVGWRHSV